MLNAEQIRFLLPALLVLPLAAAVILRFAEGQRAKITAILFASIHLVLTLVLVISAAVNSEELISSRGAPALYSNTGKKLSPAASPVFEPHFVPGDPLQDGKETSTTRYTVFIIAKDQPNIKPAHFFIGFDGLNMWLVALSSVILFSVVLIGWDENYEKVGSYFSWLFVLVTGVIGVFLSFDLLMFYVFFELTLIPVLFLIGSWGTGAMRREAAKKLFIYTLAGGLITLLGIAGIVLFVYDQTQILTFSIPELADLVQQQLHAPDAGKNISLWRSAQVYLFLALAVGFAFKIPLVPFHSWLPGAYSEAPTGVTVMLSALLAKMGTFGLLRICLPLAPDATITVGLPLLGVLGSIGILYGAFCAYAQSDARKVIAYSSISHLGFCVLAMLAFNAQGIGGSLLHMVNHGLSTGAMFLLVGMIYRRYQTSRISDIGGLWNKLPVLTFFTMVIALASVGLPGLNNFVSEMLMMAGLFDLRELSWKGLTFGLIAGFGIFLSAWYTLTLTRKMFFGPLKEPVTTTSVTDITRMEKVSVGTLALLCLLLGLFPQPVLDTMKRDVDSLANVAKDAKLRVSQYPNPK